MSKMKKKTVIPANYLDRIPARRPSIGWTTDAAGAVTLEIENKGWANRLLQLLFFRPRVSYIHLDRLGSFIWQEMDGEKSVHRMGEAVETAFGEEAHPLYERLAQYFRILDGYRFVEWVK